MNAQAKIDGKTDLDPMLSQLADGDTASDSQADPAVRLLRAGLERLAGELRQPPLDNPFLHESALRRGLEFAKANGIRPTPEPPPSDLDGSQNDLGSLRDYRLLSKLGQGGMGTVYKALHTKLDRAVALKVLPADRMHAEAIERFEREMKAVGKLSHQNIVAAHDAGEVDGRHYLVMELVDGIDLSQLVRRTGRLKIADGCELVHQAAVGLQHAHERGMVHRDIKPSNLMLAAGQIGSLAQQRKGELRTKPTVKILDMGLALLDVQHPAERRELTMMGQTMGTLDYMAPEQGTDSHNVDIRADIYSLGATLYRLLCGESPFPASKYNTPVKLLTALATAEAPSIADQRDDVPPRLAAIIKRMLAKDPDARFATPADVADALAPFAAGADLAALFDGVTTKDPRSMVDQATLATPDVLNFGSVETTPATDVVDQTLEKEFVAVAVTNHPLPQEGHANATSGAAVQRSQRVELQTGLWAGRRYPIIAVAAALGSLLLVLLATLVYRIETDWGTLVVTIDDPAVQAILQQDGLVIHDQHSDRSWTITATERKPLPSGEYQLKANQQLRVTDDSGLELATDAFELKRNGEVRVRVALGSAARVAAMETPPSITPNADRRAAEYVLSIGGRITIQENGQQRQAGTVGDLPPGDFELTGVELTGVDLSLNSALTDAGLAVFKDCENLSSLHLVSDQVSDAGLAHFQNCKNLMVLYLQGNQVGDAGLAAFKDCKNLTSLVLSAPQVSDNGLAYFNDCKNLTALYLIAPEVSDAGLANFAGCKNLMDLYLISPHVSDAGLVYFADCKELTNLGLNCEQVGDAGLSHFKDCKNLTGLSLYHSTQLSDSGLAYFKDCKNLLGLGLYNLIQVTDSGLTSFKDCQNLTHLSLDRLPGVSDAGLMHFKDSKKLVAIVLGGTSISDAGLVHLASLPNLSHIDITNTQATEAAVAKLSAALPACKIQWDGGVIDPILSTDADGR